MTSATPETIVAIATPPGRGAVGIVRISGPAAFAIAHRMGGTLPQPRQASLRHLRDDSGAVVDQALVLCFRAPHSFTGEDVVELQGHGGPAVMTQLLRTACALGARPARPGEFSERAYLNGRIDLAQAEAIADLIDASSAAAARAAQRSLDGALSKEVQVLADDIMALRVFVEGALDFSDEDIDWLSDDGLRLRLDSTVLRTQALLEQCARGRRLREGLVVTLTGRPNVGKSTLLNTLAGVDVAIVTPVAGTTRDVLREHIEIDGLPVTVIDTAGLRDSDDPIEREGIRRARQALTQAELALFLIDDRTGITDEDRVQLAQLPQGLPVWYLHNKCDLSERPAQRFEQDGAVHLRLSAATHAGLDLLRQEVIAFCGLGQVSEGVFSARSRHVDILQRTAACLHAARSRLFQGQLPELAAEELRMAQEALGEITGRVGTEDVLGQIFSSFCIGK